MLTDSSTFVHMSEVNPPELPDASHLLLGGAWKNVLVTDNVFGETRVSPYAFAARITHDSPSVNPTIVVSTRDRNILAIESEVRGALGNGVSSFLVVVGDTMPAIDHLADHLEIVRHLRDLQHKLPEFEVGMPTRFQAWQKRKRIAAGAQFLVCGPVLDPATVGGEVAKLDLQPDDPPVFLMVIPPFSEGWLDQMESMGAIPATNSLRARLGESTEKQARREFAWESSLQVAHEAERAGCAGAILMGLKFETVVDEGALAWNQSGR